MHLLNLICLFNAGDLMQGELYSALKNEKEQQGTDSSITFSGEMHFYELVEDTKDGIWLVQVSVSVTPNRKFRHSLNHSITTNEGNYISFSYLN